MRKGIVMNVDDPYLTLLTPEGEFLRARKQNRPYTVGEEIDFFPVMDSISSKYPNPFKNFFKLKSVWMSTAVLLVCFGSILSVYQSNKAYAYMAIGTDTSIELGLNKKMQVVELKGFNEEAEGIIGQLDDWKKKDAAELTAVILSELKDEGLLAPAEPVVISTVQTHQLKEEVVTRLQENIDKIKKTTDKRVEVNQYTTTKEELEKAEHSGVPVGVYHQRKNYTAKSKEKLKSKEKSTSPQPSTLPSTLPPGQEKKLDESNVSESNNNQNAQIQMEQNDNHQNNTNENKNINANGNGQDKGNQAANQSNNNKNNEKQNRPEKYNNRQDNKSNEKNKANNQEKHRNK
jgi:hypothetical protein